MSDPTSKAYLAKRVNPILEKLVIDLVVKRPEGIVIYTIVKNILNYQHKKSLQKLSLNKIKISSYH